MFKKKINIILLLVVVALWGMVIYRVVTNMLVKEQNLVSPTKTIKLQHARIVLKDSFYLPEQLNDPFFNMIKEKSESSKIMVRSAKPRMVKPKIVSKHKVVRSMISPRFDYFGFIKNEGTKNELFLLKVNGVFYKLRLNQEVDKIRVTEKRGDSVKVFYDNIYSWVKKGKR